MKTCINNSFPSKVRFRKKVHSQASDHVWFFLNLFSKRPREKKEKRKRKRRKKKKELVVLCCVVLRCVVVEPSQMRKPVLPAKI